MIISQETYIIIFAVILSIGFVQLFFYAQLLSYLRKYHPSVWDSLGKPSLLLNNSITNNRSVYLFIKKYRLIKHDELRVKAKRAYISLIAYVMLFTTVFIAGLFFVGK